jgi:hypothetical protein
VRTDTTVLLFALGRPAGRDADPVVRSRSVAGGFPHRQSVRPVFDGGPRVRVHGSRGRYAGSGPAAGHDRHGRGTITLVADTGGGTTAAHAIRIPPGPPRIQNVEILPARFGFNIHVVGHSTALAVSSATFRFQGTNLGAQPATLDVGAAFRGWFKNPSSVAMGSVFEYIQPVTVNGDRNAVRSVSVTLGSSADFERGHRDRGLGECVWRSNGEDRSRRLRGCR